MTLPEDSTTEPRAKAARPARHATLSFALFSFLPAAVMFACAGSLRWGAAWLYLGILWATTVGTRLLIRRFTPSLLDERASSVRRDDIAAWDRFIMPTIAMVGPLASWILAGLSFRLAWLGGFPTILRIVALVTLVAGSALVTWSMLVNPFFSAVVRVQHDRGQTAVSKGPYRFVRHPGYLGILLANLATPVLLDAPWTFVPIGVVVVLLVVRTALEDRTLRAELPGYAEYARATAARLIPGLW